MRDPRVRVAAALFVAPLIVGLSACGSDDKAELPKAEATSEPTSAPTSEPPEIDAASAPKNAAKDVFCATYFDTALSTAAPEERAEVYHAGARKLVEVGTPADMAEYDRRGFELWVTGLAGIDDEGAELISSANGPDDYAEAFGIADDDAGLVIGFLATTGVGCTPS